MYEANPLFVGIDLGTARVKVGIFDRQGRQHALQVAAHDGMMTASWGDVTQDAERWWRTTCRCLRAAVAQVDAARIVAISACGQGPTLVSTDSRLRPRGQALTWLDKRATAEAAQLAGMVGYPVDPSHLVAKALWQQRLDPDPLRRWYLQAWDYLTSRLSGVPMTSSLPFEAEIAASGLPRDHFPPYVAPGQVIGGLTAAAARTTGLRPGIAVVAGTNDSIASCIGAGLIEQGHSVILGGTSGGFVLCWQPVAGAWTPPPGAYPEPPGLTYLGASISSSGLALDWLASLFGQREYGTWIAQAAAVPPGADGLVLLPYIAGVFLPYTADERAPLDDPAARGVLFGLGTNHSVPHLIRAVLEGVAFGVRQVYDQTLPPTAQPTSVLTVGGQAQSELWNQIKADVLGLPVQVPEAIEAGSMGAACMAATGSGHYPSMWEAAGVMVRIATTLDPDPVAHQRYSQLYADIFTPLYPRLRDLFRRLPPLAAHDRAVDRTG